MNLHKKVLLLKHLKNFIDEQYSLGQSTENVLGMLRFKKERYSKKAEESTGVRAQYLYTYTFYLEKRIIDFEYFRKKRDFQRYNDRMLFEIINFRDKIIFEMLYGK